MRSTRVQVQRRYQVGILGERPKLQSKLRGLLNRHIAELGLPKESLLILNGPDAVIGRDRKSPFVLVFFGFQGCGGEYDDVLADVLEDSVPAFPVVQNLSKFRDHIPAKLHDVNGFEAPTTSHMDALANLVLEAFRLLRSTRRLFISYRRTETQNIALQLYEEFDRRSFDVFLDTHSVVPGQPVQEILWHRLADTDVAVLLESPGFQGSQWTMDELAMANLLNVQILQVVWPDLRFRVEASFSEFFPLSEAAFRSSALTGQKARLKVSSVAAICDATESLRARALAARYAYIVDLFCDHARELGFTTAVQQGRFITVRTPKNNLVVIPAVGVPDAPLNQSVERLAASEGLNSGPVWIVYDERGIRELWLEHLAWLNGHVAVRTVQIADCEAELRKLS